MAMWRGLGQIAPGLACFYEIESFHDGADRATETMLRGAVHQFINARFARGEGVGYGEVVEIEIALLASPHPILFDAYPTPYFTGASDHVIPN